MSTESIAPKIGKNMMIIGWVIAMGFLTWVFGIWEENRINPNSSPLTEKGGGVTQVTLIRNHRGHYVTSGTINQKAVTFLIDTGATTVAIPAELQKTLGLSIGNMQHSITANGTAQTYSTVVEHITVGGIELFNVRASILPNMPGKQILLGMSVLREIEFTQKGDKLTLRQEH
ncbi:MAG: TIGR02281 family clan AA aspartic protease [Motiliproteus sp.]